MWFSEALPNAQSIKKLTARFPGLSQAAVLWGSYVGWSAISKFISLTFVTYFVLSSGTGAGGSEFSRFEDVNEALSSNQLTLIALCATFYVLLLRLFQPYTKTTSREILTPQRIEKRFLPGFFHGAVLATGMTLAFLISGVYRYLGFFIQTDRAPLAVATLLIRVTTILALTYCEEFIFRHRILKALTRRGGVDELGPSPEAEFWHNVSAVAFTSLMFVAIKLYQFDLGWMQALTLYMVGLALGLRSLASGDFALAAGFWSALLIVFQAILSLPILGQEFSGLMLIKYQALAPETSTQFLAPESTSGETMRLITGGAGGPLAGISFQILILFDILRGTVRYRRRLEAPATASSKV